MKRYLIATIVIAAAVIGCDETIYKIELEPKGNQLNRTLTVWRQGGRGDDGKRQIREMDADELAAVAKAYSKDKPKGGARKHTFTGTFADVMPDDVGGAGRFARYESKMGVASGYIERFRGNDRPGEVLEASLKAVDEIADLLIGYLQTELGKEAEFPRLRKFMDTELRKDLKNLSVYSYLASGTSRLNWLELKKGDSDTLAQEVLARVVAYIIERKYIEPSDAPLLRRGFAEKPQTRKLLEKVLKRIAAKAGITDVKFIARLGSLLHDTEKLDVSFEAYIRTTPQYKKLFKEQKPANSDADLPDKDTSAVSLVIQPLLEKAVHIRLNFGGTPRLDIQLTLPGSPDMTNGKWNAKERTVTWKGLLTARGGDTTVLPEICYALWSKPDEKFQKARFGKVILTSQPLMNYCTWRQGLSADEAKLWDAVLMKHKPGKDLETAVEAAADPNKPMPYIEEGLRLLQNAAKE
ncbi:MAG: hypothetical protein ISS69_18190 [Phycisphaerae bacterium]|nr:hypothetical protein [Phycisphaerae bacterium]